MSYDIQQSTTAYPLLFLMVDSTDHITGKTGLSPTVTIRKVGGSFASPSGSVTEIANGWYQVAGNATDSNTLGPLLLHATGTGADPVDTLFNVVAYNPQDAVRLGLTALPNVNSGSAGAIITSGTGTAQLSVSSGRASSDVVYWNGAVLTGKTGGIPEFGIVDSGTAQAATGTTLQLRSAAAFATSDIVGSIVYIVSATAGAGQSRVITAYDGATDTATVDTWTTTPTGTIVYIVFASPPGSASAPPPVNTVQVGGGTVPSGAIPNAVAGASGGLFIAGTNAATTVTTSFTTTFTGNLTGSVASVTGNVGGNVTGSIGSLATQAKTDVATATLTTQMTESYAADGVAPTLAQAVFLTMQSVGEVSISGTTLTVKKLDGATTAATYTLNDATTPTSRTRAS